MISGVSSQSTSALTSADSSDFLKKIFNRIDTDGDGEISQDEFTAAMQKRFGQTDGSSGQPDAAALFKNADTDGDGKISLSEFQASMQQMRAGGGKGGGHDCEGGGASTAAATDSSTSEAQDLVTALFNQLDSNGDGTVSLAELKSALESSTTTGASSTTNGTNATSNTTTTDTTQTADEFEAMFKTIDTDGDGKISKGELAALLNQLTQSPTDSSTYGVSGTATDSSSTTGTILSTEA